MQGNSSFSLTDEQRAIVREGGSIKPGFLKVEAGAGTGKTHTTVAIAEQISRKGGRAAYFAYNKAIRDEAQQRLGTFADVFTVHGFAFRGSGIRNSQRKLGSLYPSHVDRCIDITGAFPDIPTHRLRTAIIDTLNSFLYSAEYGITQKHLPKYCLGMPQPVMDQVVDWTTTLFECVSPDSSLSPSLPLPHDVYLKYWHLIGSPGIELYDTVLVDEAQDCNGVTLDAVSGCKSATLIGDSHQQIYAFRGAIDALSSAPGHTLPLTQSFRYGPIIAALANSVLAYKSIQPAFKLRGLSTIPSEIAHFSPSLKHTRLYRTNVELIQDAMFFMDTSEKVAIVGDFSDIKMKLQSSLALLHGDIKNVRHPLIAMFKTWGSLCEYAENTIDPEIHQILSIVEKYGTRVIDVLKMLSTPMQEKGAKIILSTAHRAKGREWENVIICQDFDSSVDGFKKLTPDEFDWEINLLYVAITRASNRLALQSAFAEKVFSKL